MSEFDFDDKWDVDKTAEKLNTSLFGSGKERKQKQAKLSKQKKANSSWSAIIHDSDDEKYTKKDKRKLKEKQRKHKKKQPQAETGESDAPVHVSSASPTKGKRKRENHQTDEIGDIAVRKDGEKKKGKKRKRDIDSGSGDLDEKKTTKKRKVSSSESENISSKNGQSGGKKWKKSVTANESLDSSSNMETEESKGKRQRKRKKKNNPLKNKYRHLVVNGTAKSEQAEKGEHLPENHLKDETKGIVNRSESGAERKRKNKKSQSSATIVAEAKPTEMPSQTGLKKRTKDKQQSDHHTEQSDGQTSKGSGGMKSPKTKPQKKQRKIEDEALAKPSSTSQTQSPKIENVQGKNQQAKTAKNSSARKESKLTKSSPSKLNKNILKQMIDESELTKKTNKKKDKKKKKKNEEDAVKALEKEDNDGEKVVKKKKKGKVASTVSNGASENLTDQGTAISKSPFSSIWGKAANLAEQAKDTLNSARFRYLNEQLYTCSGQEAMGMFKDDKEAFQVYHQGYSGQVAKWEVNPLNVMIKQIKDKPSSLVIADFGCGEGRLSESVPQTVHSFDLVALKKHVIACDMAKVPLASESVDIAVFCLSLMGTNLSDYILEANRVLKPGGLLKIAEVVSRFSGPSTFINAVCSHGFTLLNKRDLTQMFYLMDFKKNKTVKKSTATTLIKLRPCIYKRR